AIDFSSIVEATDFDGDSVTAAAGGFLIAVENDIPVEIAPDPVSMENSGTLLMPTTATENLDDDGNIDDDVGADQVGTIAFTNIIEGSEATGVISFGGDAP
ncbi:MAG: hypothetical protein GTO41_16205, partial [Burkholderiales bacterium]|nr:hypothetical protein [Burkholderiales bacterium]